MNRINKESIAEILKQKKAKQGVHYKNIATHLYNNYFGGLFDGDNPSIEKVEVKVNSILNNDVKKKAGSIFSKVRNPKTKKFKQGYYKIKQKRDTPIIIKPQPIDILNTESKRKDTNLFTGKAGECAVMSELLFREYNVNSMLVDDGVDIVATKNNIFYYIQVKTTILTDNKIATRITDKRFDSYIGMQMRYVIVVRGVVNSIKSNIYFVFNNSEVQKLLFEKAAKRTPSGIQIKIEINKEDGKPYAFAENRSCIEFNMNKFELT